jgi:precorrin-2 dehydrogenase / sirohydrochlorin ferrochelatase
VEEKRYYVACLDVEGRDCLVVGGGSVALEKARGLVECGARVTVVAPDVAPELRALPVELVERPYRSGDLAGRFLVMAATSDAELNRRVYEQAEEAGLLCNVADAPEICNFILPAVHRQDPIAIAVTTGGASPALAQRIRAEIADLYGPEYAELARELRALRPWAKQRFGSYEERRDFFRALVAEALP